MYVNIHLQVVFLYIFIIYLSSCKINYQIKGGICYGKIF